MIDIYSSDWIFYDKAGIEVISKDVVVKKIPLEFIIAEQLPYKRAISIFGDKRLKDLQDDKKTGLKKFKIKFKNKIGEVNNNERHLEDLHQ